MRSRWTGEFAPKGWSLWGWGYLMPPVGKDKGEGAPGQEKGETTWVKPLLKNSKRTFQRLDVWRRDVEVETGEKPFKRANWFSKKKKKTKTRLIVHQGKGTVGSTFGPGGKKHEGCLGKKKARMAEIFGVGFKE